MLWNKFAKEFALTEYNDEFELAISDRLRSERCLIRLDCAISPFDESILTMFIMFGITDEVVAEEGKVCEFTIWTERQETLELSLSASLSLFSLARRFCNSFTLKSVSLHGKLIVYLKPNFYLRLS